MPRNALLVLAVLATTLLLRADSCTVEERSIAVSAGSTLRFTVEGAGTGTSWAGALDLGQDIRDALLDLDEDDRVDSVRVVGARMEFLRNDGFSTVRRGNVFAGESGSEQRILEFRAADNEAGTAGLASFGSVNAQPDSATILLSWKTAGMRAVHALADSFLARWYRGEDPQLLLSLRADWSPAAPDTLPDDFDLEIRLDLQIHRILDAEVYTF